MAKFQLLCEKLLTIIGNCSRISKVKRRRYPLLTLTIGKRLYVFVNNIKYMLWITCSLEQVYFFGGEQHKTRITNQ